MADRKPFVSTTNRPNYMDSDFYRKYMEQREKDRKEREEQRKRAEAEAEKKKLAAAEAEADAGEGGEDATDDVQFSDYQPLKLRGGLAHPDPVVENASLSAVRPPDLGGDVHVLGLCQMVTCLDCLIFQVHQHRQQLRVLRQLLR